MFSTIKKSHCTFLYMDKLYLIYTTIAMTGTCLPHGYLDNCIFTLIICCYCVAVTGYEDIEESKMDDIQSNSQNAWKDGLIAPQLSHSHSPLPPPPPPRCGKQEQNRKARISRDLALATSNFANTMDDDVVSGYEYVSNPMKVNNKQTSNGCNQWKEASVEIHRNQHIGINKSVPDGALDTEPSGDDKGEKQLSICSAYEAKSGAKGKSNSKSNACFKPVNLKRDITGLTIPSLYEQYPRNTCSKQADSCSHEMLTCEVKSPVNDDKRENMDNPKPKVPERGGYQKLIRETMSSTHTPRDYQQLIKETMEEPPGHSRWHGILDLALRQSMELSDTKENNGSDQKQPNEVIYSVHESQKRNSQTKGPFHYISSVKHKHTTL